MFFGVEVVYKVSINLRNNEKNDNIKNIILSMKKIMDNSYYTNIDIFRSKINGVLIIYSYVAFFLYSNLNIIHNLFR